MDVTTVKQLGMIIRKRRIELGYTQSYLSEFTGFSVSFISEVENGKETAQIGKIFELIKLLGMDIEVTNR